MWNKGKTVEWNNRRRLKDVWSGVSSTRVATRNIHSKFYTILLHYVVRNVWWKWNASKIYTSVTISMKSLTSSLKIWQNIIRI